MQHIPHHSLEDIERSREEMASFMNEKHVWPNLTLTGEDIHNAYLAIWPNDARPWDALEHVERWRWNDMAIVLNRELDARQAWFEGEDRAIEAVRCPRCGQMFTDFKLKEHPCL